MRNRFTERDTEAFYDAEDALYRSFWDSEGSLHWGWFDRETGDDFLKACANLNRNMVEKAKIQASSQVLATEPPRPGLPRPSVGVLFQR